MLIKNIFKCIAIIPFFMLSACQNEITLREIKCTKYKPSGLEFSNDRPNPISFIFDINNSTLFVYDGFKELYYPKKKEIYDTHNMSNMLATSNINAVERTKTTFVDRNTLKIKIREEEEGTYNMAYIKRFSEREYSIYDARKRNKDEFSGTWFMYAKNNWNSDSKKGVLTCKHVQTW